METAKIFSESEERPINYILCQDEAALVYLANLGCIEMNPWNSTIDAPENPDYLVLDLDPEDIGFDKVVETALAAKELMDELGLAGFCKTSGATGLHIFLPLAKKYNYEQTKEFARLLAYLINARRPEITSIQRLPKKRQKKVYVDFLQNRRGQTMASAYSVRPRPGAPVSAPLEWGELSADLSPLDFTMKNIKKRLDKKSDLWKGVLGKGIDIEKVLDEIKKGGLI
jgi:bifunctional non-homologous end joining protein LigD